MEQSIIATFLTPATVECIAFSIALIAIHRWLISDKALYKRALLFTLFILASYILGCSLLYGVLIHIAPAFLILLFLLHNKSITMMHCSPHKIFAHETRPATLWINELIKAHFYAYHSDKKLILYFMSKKDAYLSFEHSMPIDMPITHQFLATFIEGSKSEVSFLIDSYGHIRSINPTIIENNFFNTKDKSYFHSQFDHQTKTFTLFHDDKNISFLSPGHLSLLIQELLNNSEEKIGESDTIHYTHKKEYPLNTKNS